MSSILAGLLSAHPVCSVIFVLVIEIVELQDVFFYIKIPQNVCFDSLCHKLMGAVTHKYGHCFDLKVHKKVKELVEFPVFTSPSQ